VKALVLPVALRGAVVPPPSKSQAHRLIVAAALARGTSHIRGVDLSEDIQATLNGVKSLGASCVLTERDGLMDVALTGAAVDHHSPLPEVDCGESGSTLRFLIPVALVLRGGGLFTGHARLPQRPLEPYFSLFRGRDIRHAFEDSALVVQGTLEAGVFRLRGDISSQFFSGLLFALPLLPGESRIELATPLESQGYVDMTLDVLRRHGVDVAVRDGECWTVSGGRQYAASDNTVEKDFSQAAFFYAAQGIGNEVDVQGLNSESCQGDRVIRRISARLGDPGTVTINVSQCPDLVPAIAVQAALRKGERTHIVNAGRLRLKESDRLATVASELNKIGAKIQEKPDELVISGVESFSGGDVESHQDHRIAMMLAVAATRAKAPLFISGAESVRKSYPGFWEQFKDLGGGVRLLPDNQDAERFV